MTTVEQRIAGPERAGGQGLDYHQQESGNRAIIALLTHPVRGEQVDLVTTYRADTNPQTSEPANHGEGAYEVWAKRGVVRFVRSFAPEGGYSYSVVEQASENPIADQDPTGVGTKAEEVEAAASFRPFGNRPVRPPWSPSTELPARLREIAQLFDSPNAPDIVISPKTNAFGRQPGQHGAPTSSIAGTARILGPGISHRRDRSFCAHVD